MPVLVNPDDTNDIELSEEEEEDFQDAAEHMMEDEDIFMAQDIPTRYQHYHNSWKTSLNIQSYQQPVRLFCFKI